MSSPTPPPYLPPPSSPASFPPPLYPAPQAVRGVHPKRRISAAIDAAVMITAYVVLFMAWHEKECDRGDWLTCSGPITYPTASIVMYGIGTILILGNFFILPLATKGRSIGKLLTGVRVVDSATGETASMRTIAMRAALNLVIVGGYALADVLRLIERVEPLEGLVERVGPIAGTVSFYLLIFGLIELITLITTGSRVVDRLTRTDVR